jgi:hypothetical protein
MAAALKAVLDDSPANRVDELKAQRADLLAREKRSAARTATGAARGAGANIDAELADLRAKLVALDDEIAIAALECMEGERLAILDELTAVHKVDLTGDYRATVYGARRRLLAVGADPDDTEPSAYR